MKILWFPRLQFDIDRLHITTWKEMCDCLENKGHQVRIAIAGKKIKGVFERDYIPVFTIRLKYLRILTFWTFGLVRFMSQVLSFKPDIIILNIFTIWFSLPLLILGVKKNITIIVDHRNPYTQSNQNSVTFQDRIFLLYTRISINYCKKFLDGMTVITDYYKDLIVRQYGYDPHLIDVWSSGVNIHFFSHDISKPISEFEFLRDRFVVMQHGQISKNRGVFESVKAMKYVDDESICMILLGDSIGNDNSRIQLQSLIRELGLEDRVFLPGTIPYEQVPSFIDYADCGLLAYPNIEYWNLNNPIKLLEYMAMEKVLICTDMWTFKDVLKDSPSVYYLEKNSPEKIAKGINYYYANRIHIKKWGREARNIVIRRFTWQAQTKRLVNFCNYLKQY
ncbi:MAG: glycosyltransferase [Desulfotignum sp.]|nr:glycosyltransferase [Desulfotignum sp.]MCF8086441.1 glycosyltransferase [Desulfotignum sp.]MCF8135843.1 glycosyltransferase [Desulfotignum sp.]